MPKFAIRYLAKIAVSRASQLNFSFLQLPSDAVNFSALPLPHVLCKFRQRVIWKGGRMPKYLIRYLGKIALLSDV